MQYCDGTNHIAMGREPGTTTTCGPPALTQVGTISNTNLNGAENVAVAGNYAYVASFTADSLTIIDISTPATPVQVGTISNTDLNGATDVALSGNYAYVTSLFTDSLTVIDISTPSTPVQVGTISNADLDGARGVAVSGNHAYVASDSADSLTVIDISTPAAPSQVGTISNSNLNGAFGVAVSGNYAYVASGIPNRLTIIDISTPATPVQVGTVGSINLDGARGVAISGNYAYVASFTADSLTIIDISTPSTPVLVGAISNTDLNGAEGVSVVGNYAYVASFTADSLTIIDISTPSTPVQVGTTSNADLDGARGVAVSGNYAYVASFTADTLTVIDISPSCTSEDGLIGYWRLDETSGTTAIDSSFNSYTGTMVGGLDAANDSVTGVVDGALNFDGTDDKIDFTMDSRLQNLTQMTLAAWVNWNGIDGDAPGILSLRDVTDFGMRFNGTNVQFRGRAWDTEGTWEIGGAYSLPVDEWVHIAVTYDYNQPVGTDPIFYINGVLQTASEAVSPAGSYTASTATEGRIGAQRITTADREFNGTLDDVRIYDRVLSAGEVSRLYNAGRDRGLVGHWKLDEIVGPSLDSSINGSTLSDNGTIASRGDIGIIDQSLSTDSTGDLFTNAPQYDDMPQLTYSAWINPSDTGVTVGQIIVKGGVKQFQIDNTLPESNALELRISTTSGAINVHSVNDIISTNQWTHVAATWDGSLLSSGMRLYVNGVETAYGVTSNGSGSVDSDSAFNLSISSSVSGSAITGNFDDVRIYNRVLSADEIQALYRARFTMCDSPNGYEAEVIYNSDNHVMQFCSADDWQGMNSSAGDGGAGCAAPVGAAGDLVYNDTFNVMQFCEGDEWIGIGK
ncbi:MAG: LamG-like jellyroll fold domain-containing protein [Pseudomonadota bacterium]